MIDLTPQQVQALETEEVPIRIRNPQSASTYVLIPGDVYDRLKGLLADADDDAFVEGMYAQTMELMGREGWDDPEMDIYNDLDPRRKA